MTDADKRINALIDRAGCPMMVVKNTEQKSFEDVRRTILRIADEQYDGSMIEYIRDLANTIDRLEGALENVIIERDAALAKVPKWISVEERLPDVGRNVMIFSACGGIAEGEFISSGWVQFRWSSRLRIDDVTHWMPLPEAPVEQRDAKGD